MPKSNVRSSRRRIKSAGRRRDLVHVSEHYRRKPRKDRKRSKSNKACR